MKRTGSTAVLVVAVVVAGSMAAAPVAAKGAKQQVGPKVELDGAALPKGGDDLGTRDDPAIGKTAPTLTGEGFDGEPVTFASGAPRIVIFLSHSCPHCQAEVPRIVKLEKRAKLDGVEVQTVTTNTSEDLPNYPPSKWLKREKWPFSPVLADDARLRAFLGFGGETFPYFVFIDAAGTVVARVSGEIEPSALAAAARRLAEGRAVV